MRAYTAPGVVCQVASEKRGLEVLFPDGLVVFVIDRQPGSSKVVGVARCVGVRLVACTLVGDVVDVRLICRDGWDCSD